MKKVKIGIVGCGAIGEGVSLFIERKLQSAASLYALADRDRERAKRLQKKLRSLPRIYDVDTLIEKVDLVIEAASVEAARFILEKIL